jgi:DNA polymerase-3 subunit delta'
MSAPDQIEGAPHPRDTPLLFGQAEAEAAFLAAFATGRLHHGWLLTGPKGVGKATLAWRIARFLLTQPPQQEDDGLFGAPPAPTSLAVDPDHPVARRIQAGAEGGLKSITRTPNPTTDRMRDQIVVEDIRRLGGFFQMSAADGGRRVVIIDAADDMNTSAANALLKMLEEPPANATLLLISHQPSRLLPTIRSRCRVLRLGALGAQDMGLALDQAGMALTTPPQAMAELTSGSVGAALSLALLDGHDTYAELISLLGRMPDLDRPRALKMAEAAAQRGAEARLTLLIELLDLALARLARTGAMGAPPATEATPGEADVLRRRAPNAPKGRAWAELAQQISARVQHGRAVNLDPAALVLDTLFKIQKTAAG